MDLKCTANIKCDQGAIRAVRFNGNGFCFRNTRPRIGLLVNIVCCLVDGEYCLTCGSDKKIKLWNPYKELCLKTYAGHGDCVMDASSSCDSR